MEIIQRLIPDNKKPKYQLDNGKLVTFPMTPEYITIHETDNTRTGASADAHSRLQLNGNSRVASWHVQVDCKQAIQSLPFNEAGIHAGDGINGNGNRKSIGIEICVNSDGDYEKAIRNAAEVVKQLMKQFNIPIEKVVTHKKWSGKNCPRNLLNGRWDEFINLCKSEVVKEEVKLYQPTSTALVELTEKVLIELTDNTKHERALSKTWLDKFKKKELTESDAIGLVYAAIDRGLLK